MWVRLRIPEPSTSFLVAWVLFDRTNAAGDVGGLLLPHTHNPDNSGTLKVPFNCTTGFAAAVRPLTPPQRGRPRLHPRCRVWTLPLGDGRALTSNKAVEDEVALDFWGKLEDATRLVGSSYRKIWQDIQVVWPDIPPSGWLSRHVCAEFRKRPIKSLLDGSRLIRTEHSAR